MTLSPDYSGGLAPEPGRDPTFHSPDGDFHTLDVTGQGNKGVPEERPLVHKVGNPPGPNVGSKILNTVKETMFPDDPFRQFKGQSRKRKWILGLQYVFPILEWVPNYKLNLLTGDLIAGLTIASLAIPQVHTAHLIFSTFWMGHSQCVSKSSLNPLSRLL